MLRATISEKDDKTKKKVILFLTDGDPSDTNRSLIFKTIRDCNTELNNSIIIFIYGIGNAVNQEILKDIANLNTAKYGYPADRTLGDITVKSYVNPHFIIFDNIRSFLDQTSYATLIHAFITYCLDYCNGLYYGMPAYQRAKLLRIQNAVACLVCSTPRFSHITPVLADLHWLPVKFRVFFKILTLTFRAKHGLAPKYMTDLIATKNHSCYDLRSSKDLLLANPLNDLKPPLGARTFTYAAPTEWNSLPSTIRNITVIETFEIRLINSH